VLALDADYILPDGFRAELEKIEAGEETAAWSARFRYCIFGRELRGSLYPPRPVLFRRDRCHHVQDGHTQRLEVQGATGRLASEIRHDDRKPLSNWLRSQMRYADLEAQHLLTTPAADLNRADRIRRWMFAAPALVFCYTLFWKGLLLDGWPGWYYVMQRTAAEVILSLKLMRHRMEGVPKKA
jgi:hypothetical protein